MTTVGIDLGTTNTVAAVDGEVLELGAHGHHTAILPSVVAFPPNGATLVGTAARRRRAIDPRNTIFSAKRIIGRPYRARETREFQDRYPYALVATAAGGVAFATRAGQRTPEEIAAVVLGVVHERVADRAADARVFVGVPSAFGAAQRAATAAAATAAGLPQVTIVDEPLATAWAYTSFGNVGARYAAVYDLGGGTFDLAVLDCAEPPFRVLATGGDPYLGGDDIDVRLADHAAASLLTEHGWDVRSDPEAFDRLLVECERAKIRLSFAPRTTLALGEVDPGAPIATATFTLERDLLERLCYDLVQRTFSVCDEVLHRAGVRAQDLGAVFLAGGSTSLPSVRAGVERYFGRPPRQEFDPMEVLAIGSSLMQ